MFLFSETFVITTNLLYRNYVEHFLFSAVYFICTLLLGSVSSSECTDRLTLFPGQVAVAGLKPGTF
jgi:hypothetical protein